MTAGRTAPATSSSPGSHTTSLSSPTRRDDDAFSVRDRIVVITGGLGKLGRSFCRGFLDRGAYVALLDVREPAGSELDALLGGTTTDRLLPLEADVTDGHVLSAALEEIAETWDVPHALINNAGLDSPPDAPAEENGPFETYPPSSFERVLDVNTTGPFLACQVFGSAMAHAGRGSIVNVGSIYGFVSPDQRLYDYRRLEGAPFTKPVAYTVSKSALYGLTRYLATYWGASGVRVNAVTLGGVHDGQDPEFLTGYGARVPMGRMANPGEYDGAMVFLVSDASSYMTGANLTLDGGFTAW